MELFLPERVFFEPSSLKYDLGRQLYSLFSKKNIEIIRAPLQNVYRSIPGSTERQKFPRAKKTLVVATKKGFKLDVCKPSADFEFSLSSNCPGNCEYCYLHTTQGFKPYLRTYVNLEDIFDSIIRHINNAPDAITTFEAASGGDPLSLEHLTGSVAKAIELFGDLQNARLRIVTKFNNVDSLLSLKHNGNTRYRASINSSYIIQTFEHNTATLDERLEAVSKMATAGYPIGFIVAPLMVYSDWEEEYRILFDNVKDKLKNVQLREPLTFELIQHRFTPTAKSVILDRFPGTKLDLDESNRVLKWGKFGRYKYVYPKETAQNLKEYISGLIHSRFPESRIEYFT